MERYVQVSQMPPLTASSSMEPSGNVLVASPPQYSKDPDTCRHDGKPLKHYGGPKGQFRRCDQCGMRWKNTGTKTEMQWTALPPLPYPGATAAQALAAEQRRSGASSRRPPRSSPGQPASSQPSPPQAKASTEPSASTAEDMQSLRSEIAAMRAERTAQQARELDLHKQMIALTQTVARVQASSVVFDDEDVELTG